MSTTFYNTFSITISYGKNFGAYLCTGKPNQFPMAPPAGSDSGLRPPQGQSRHWKSIWFSSYITYSKGAKILAPFEYNIDIKNRWDIKTTSGSALAQWRVGFDVPPVRILMYFKYKHQNFYLVQTSFSEFVQ